MRAAVVAGDMKDSLYWRTTAVDNLGPVYTRVLSGKNYTYNDVTSDAGYMYNALTDATQDYSTARSFDEKPLNESLTRVSGLVSKQSSLESGDANIQRAREMFAKIMD